MANDPFLGMLGLTRRAGKLAFGDELVREMCMDKKARAVFVAADAGASTAKKAAKCSGMRKTGGSTAAALGASTRIASTAARVIRESPIQYSKLTKRMPSIIQNKTTASGVLSAPNTPDKRLINTMANATISAERTAMAVQ